MMRLLVLPFLLLLILLIGSGLANPIPDETESPPTAVTENGSDDPKVEPTAIIEDLPDTTNGN